MIQSVLLHRITLFCAIVAATLCLMTAAFHSGYPIVYSDTSTYIESGFTVETPFDRPIMYGLFLRAASLNGFSLWTVIFAQSAIIACLIFATARVVVGKNYYLPAGLISAIVASLGTGLSFTASQLIADIFTPAALLSALLILSGKFKKTALYSLYFLFFLSVTMHLAHLSLMVVFLIAAFIVHQLFVRLYKVPRRTRSFGVLLGLTVLAVATMGSALSKSRHVYLMGAMTEHGIVKKFLDDRCATEDYALCQYKDSLPEFSWQFVWDEESPLYKIGGWGAAREEFNTIIHETLTDPKYIGLHIDASVKATLQQLIRFDVGEGNGAFLEDTRLYQRIKKYVPREISAYRNSHQSNENLGGLTMMHSLHVFVVIASILVITWFCVRYRNAMGYKTLWWVAMLVLGILVNAWSAGTFGNAIGRLGVKVIWLIPLLATLIPWVVFKPGTTRS